MAIGEDPQHGRGRGLLTCIDATKSGDITSGGKIWSYDGIDRSLSSVSIADGLLYAADMPGRVHCLDAETGKCYWVHDCKSDIWTSTLVVDGKVFVGTRKGLYVLAAGRHPEVLATIHLGSAIRSMPVAADGTLYVASQRYLWAVEDLKRYHSSPLAATPAPAEPLYACHDDRARRAFRRTRHGNARAIQQAYAIGQNKRSMMELIRLENITKTYHVGEVDVPVLKGVSLSIARGEMVALMGASGSGKTTLMNILGCLDRPSSGCFWLDGQEMSRLTPNQRALIRTAKLGFVFQSFNLLPRTTAVQNVLMPLDYAPRRVGGDDARRLSRSLLERVGLADRYEHEPSQMSGGQQQRVAIARALVNHPALLLADEPTGNLDSRTSVEILQMFQALNAEGLTVILVTHDAKVAAYAHRTIRIADGLIEEDESDASHAQDERAIPQSHPRRMDAASAIGGNGSAKTATTRTIAHRHATDGHRSTSAVATAARAAAAGTPHGRVIPPPACAQGGPHISPRAAAEAKPRQAAAAFALSVHAAHGLRRLAAQQDALGAHGPGRDHRRGRGDRHVGDRPGIQDRPAEDHR